MIIWKSEDVMYKIRTTTKCFPRYKTRTIYPDVYDTTHSVKKANRHIIFVYF